MLLGNTLHAISKTMTPEGILFSIGKRKLGIFRDGIFKTKRDPEKHYFFKFGGYGVNSQLLKELQSDDVIVIHEKGRGKDRYLKATVKEREEKSLRRSYNGEEQSILNLAFMH